MSPISMSPCSSTSTLASECSNPDSLPQSPGGTDQTPHDERQAQTNYRHLARILDDLEGTIADYPSTLPRLDSAAILRIRTRHSLDELHLNRLHKIFPKANHQHLSALAALLIAQSYLATLPPITPHQPSRLAAPSSESLPIKAASKPANRPPNAAWVHEWARSLRKRAEAIKGALHVIVQKEMGIVCGRFDDVLWRTLMCLVETVELGW